MKGNFVVQQEIEITDDSVAEITIRFLAEEYLGMREPNLYDLRNLTLSEDGKKIGSWESCYHNDSRFVTLCDATPKNKTALEMIKDINKKFKKF